MYGRLLLKLAEGHGCKAMQATTTQQHNNTTTQQHNNTTQQEYERVLFEAVGEEDK
jgi:hypothetical protein